MSVLETIISSARQRRIVKIIYRENDGTSEGWRYIEPLKLKEFENGVGLFAWDKGKDGIRLFMVEKIENAEMTNDVYIPKYPVEIT